MWLHKYQLLPTKDMLRGLSLLRRKKKGRSSHIAFLCILSGTSIFSLICKTRQG